MATERRISPRMNFAATVYVHDGRTIHSAAMIDIGLGGLSVCGYPPFKLGSPVRVVIKSEWLAVPLQARGIVVRTSYGNQPSIAIQFTVIGREYESVLLKAARAQHEPSGAWILAG